MSIGASLMGRIDWTQPHPARRGRFGVAIPVDLSDRPGEAESAASTRNISPEGAFIATRRPLWVGEPVTLRFSFPGYHVPIGIRAEVRWIRREGQGEGRAAGVGVRFIDPSIAACAAIAALASLRDER